MDSNLLLVNPFIRYNGSEPLNNYLVMIQKTFNNFKSKRLTGAKNNNQQQHRGMILNHVFYNLNQRSFFYLDSTLWPNSSAPYQDLNGTFMDDTSVKVLLRGRSIQL